MRQSLGSFALGDFSQRVETIDLGRSLLELRFCEPRLTELMEGGSGYSGQGQAESLQETMRFRCNVSRSVPVAFDAETCLQTSYASHGSAGCFD